MHDLGGHTRLVWCSGNLCREISIDKKTIILRLKIINSFKERYFISIKDKFRSFKWGAGATKLKFDNHHSLHSRPHSSQHSAAFGRTTGSPICFPFRLTPLCQTPQLVAGGGGGGACETIPHSTPLHQHTMAPIATKEETRMLVNP